MKVLSIKEPFATLIKDGHKLIETRSFKTSYRGTIYIHASVKKVDDDFLNNKVLNGLIKNISYNYGNIICRANLIDCKLMDEAFLNEIKENEKEYSLGIYKLGRYAWILDNVEVIESIPAKGNLNIWNFYKEEDILKLLPETSLQETILLTKKYMKNNKNSSKMFDLVYNNKIIYEFITFEKGDKVYWFEFFMKEYRGIHEYNSYDELFNKVKNIFNQKDIVIKEVR